MSGIARWLTTAVLERRLGVAEVAAVAGAKPATVRAYDARGLMPASTPCPCCGHGPTWPAGTISTWLDTRPGKPGRPKGKR